MKNSMFSGWSEVFLFTLKQGMSKKYKTVTMAGVLIFLMGAIAINIFMAVGQKKDDNISEIEKVYIIDESEIPGIEWNDSKRFDREKFQKVIFEESSLDVEDIAVSLDENDKYDVIVNVSETKEGYTVNVYIPYESEITESDCKNLAEAVKDIINEGLIAASGIDDAAITYVVSSINTEYLTIGESSKSNAMLALTTIFPIVIILFLYFMVIIYGQSMGQIVIMEKTSKLVENLLLSTKPYGLIFGKIFATAFLAIIQVVSWIGATVTGFIAGNSLACELVYEEYDNAVLSLFKEIAADSTSNAFTKEAIILSVIAVCLAFLFYCMLSGAVAGFACDADELGSMMVFYNTFIIIGFFGSYIIPSTVSQEWIKILVRVIPFSAAFLLPGEIILGTVKTGAAVIYLIVLFSWILLTAILAGKVYQDKLFYIGKSIKNRLPWVKPKDEENAGDEWQLLHDEAGRPLEKTQKTGYFFLAVAPLAIFLVIQIITSLLLTNIMTRVDLNGIDLNLWEAKDFADYYHGIEPVLNPLTIMVSHLLIITVFGLWLYFIRRGIDRNNIIHLKNLLNYKLLTLIGVCIISGLCLLALANGVVAIEERVIPSVVENFDKMAETSGMGKSIFAIIATVCLAPVGEELLCRGVCLHFGKKAFGSFFYANILQAVLFGMIHMNWVQGIYAFFIGIVLGILTERYKSLLPAMTVHFIINFSATVWTPKVLERIDMTFAVGIVFFVVAAVVTTAVLYFTKPGQEA